MRILLIMFHSHSFLAGAPFLLIDIFLKTLLGASPLFFCYLCSYLCFLILPLSLKVARVVVGKSFVSFK